MCDERDRLIDYLYNECGADERRRVEVHLESCDTCREEIRGLRGTREDLLAWDVPDRGSVWKPFAPARVAPSWRDVPRWSLAVAASIMFLIGGAGGFATRAFVPRVGAGPSSAETGASTANLAAIQQQLRDFVRTELNQRVVPVSATPASTATAVPAESNDALLRRVEQLIAESEQRQGQRLDSNVQSVRASLLTAFLQDTNQFDFRNKQKIQQLTERVSKQDELIRNLQLALASQPGR